MKPRPLHVLITDDEPMLREVIAEFLDCLDFCTHAEAGDGAEALEYLDAHRVDCLLSDIKMPRMNLEEALPRITSEHPETIVIATSGYSDLEVASKIFRLGAHEFLAKPLDLDLLEDALKWIARRNSILEMAESLFQTSNGNNGDWDRRFDEFRQAATEGDDPHAERMKHAARVAELAPIILSNGDNGALRQLNLAALLHEIGLSNKHLETISQNSALNPDQLNLVRTQSLVSSRLIGRIPGAESVARIVESHLHWADQNAAEEAGWDAVRRLGCLLGVLNAVDGLFSSRADRGPFTPDAAKAILKDFYLRTSLTALKQTLAPWPRIVEHYKR